MLAMSNNMLINLLMSRFISMDLPTEIFA